MIHFFFSKLQPV